VSTFEPDKRFAARMGKIESVLQGLKGEFGDRVSCILALVIGPTRKGENEFILIRGFGDVPRLLDVIAASLADDPENNKAKGLFEKEREH